MSLRESLFLPLANHLPRFTYFDRVRWRILRLAGMDIPETCRILGPVTITPIGCARNISIGGGTFINTTVRFGCPTDRVTIGRHVQVGPCVCFETVNHDLQSVPGRNRPFWTKPIVVEDEAWIGAGVIVLAGVTIGRGSVVAAGAVVARDVEPYTVAGGVPARTIKVIERREAMAAPTPA